MICYGEETFPLVGCLNADLFDLVEEFILESLKGPVGRQIQTEYGGYIFQEIVGGSLALEEEVGDIRCTCANLVEGRLGMIREAAEAYAFERREVD